MLPLQHSQFELDVVKTVSFTSESVTTRREKGGNESEISQIRANPIIERVSVNYGVDKFGEAEIFIEILAPHQKLLPNDNIPPNDFPQPKFIHILNDIGSFYDKNNKLLFKQRINTSNYNVIDAVRNIDDSDFELMIQEAKDKGAIINDLGNNYLSIRLTGNMVASNVANAGGRASELNDNTYGVSIYNMSTMQIIGTAIYDNNDNMLFRMYFDTDIDANGNQILKATQQEIYDVDPVSQKPVLIQTNTEYTDLVIEENIQ